MRLGNVAILVDPGLGKSKISLDTVGILALQGKVKKVAIVTTIDGIEVWKDEVAKHYPLPAAVATFGGGVVERVNRGVAGPFVKFYIVNYDQYRKRSRSHKKYEYPVGKGIEAWHPDLLIFDESHRLKRAGGVTAQFAYRSVQRMRQRSATDHPLVHLLTGTPNPKGWQDIFAQYRVMDSDIFGTNKSDYEERYCEYGQGRRKYTIVKYKRLKELKRKINDHAIVIPEDKAEGLPRRLWQNVPVVLPPRAKQLYMDLAEDLIAEWKGGVLQASNPGVRRLRLLQITGGFTSEGQQIHRAKLDALGELVLDLMEAEKQVVVYARFIPEVEAISALLDKLRVQHRAIRGAVHRRDRAQARREFDAGRLRALVFQVATGSEAITLTSANETVFYSLPDGWKDYYQATKRTHRIGQKASRVRYRHIVARGTLDYSVLRTLRAKGDIHRELMGNAERFLLGLPAV